MSETTAQNLKRIQKAIREHSCPYSDGEYEASGWYTAQSEFEALIGDEIGKLLTMDELIVEGWKQLRLGHVCPRDRGAP